MSKPTIQLNNIIASDKVKIFDTTQGVFIGHVEKSTVFNKNSKDTNMYSMRDVLRDQRLDNFYEIDHMDIQTNRSTLSRSELTNSYTDFITQYNPDNLGYISVTQVGGIGYMISDLNQEGLQERSFDGVSGYQLYIQDPYVYVYPPSANITLSGVSGNMLPIYNLSGVNFNYLTEVDPDDVYFEFKEGLAFGNTTNAKNYMNQQWDTGSMVTSATTTSVSATLDNTRTYIKIGSSNDGLFLAYKHDRGYTSDVVNIANLREFNDYSLASLQVSSSVTDIPMSADIYTDYAISAFTTSASTLDGQDYAKRFCYVETMESDGRGGFNRYDLSEGKKTNLYSINIQNANINNNTDLGSSAERERIKTSITNVIRNVIGACTPLNTQLFKIYWNGE